ncbi:amidohydrolase family protein [Amycolatopsis sp. NBC_01307]|uniref:amidohydrolase family protein n=1 Tax=Amycolatopsis sp. NBC_01307 TaxID=2903561 RepID=UPI002E11B618|nr:amidohydrolase family protein [Amycolatopsis sp. NBC_01307]
MKIIGLEEHFVTRDVVDAWCALEPEWQDLSLTPSTRGDSARRLADFGDERLAGMAKAGLDVQVLSLSTPGVQNLASADAVALQTAANDTLAEAIRARPGSFQGLATLATPRPAAAAAELERAVTELGLNGAMLFGRTRDRNMDEPAFWPIYEAAAALKAPLHLHPQSPPAAVRGAYYSGYGPRVDAALATHGIGWHYDSGVQVLRLILSGVFDRFPDLRVIVGHWGEMVLFYLDRIDSLNELAGLRRPVSDYFRTNIFLAPSGILSRRYLRWATEVAGVDRILFSTDYPFVTPPPGGARAFFAEASLSDADRLKIASGNWDRLCASIRR